MKKTLNILFIIGVISFMLLGSIIVAVQLFGVITVNGQLAIYISNLLSKTAFVIVTITGLLGFIQGYVNKWDMGD